METGNNNYICGTDERCPLHKDMKECPFEKFNKMEMFEIIDHLKNTNNDEISLLMNNYRQCQHLKNQKEK